MMSLWSTHMGLLAKEGTPGFWVPREVADDEWNIVGQGGRGDVVARGLTQADAVLIVEMRRGLNQSCDPGDEDRLRRELRVVTDQRDEIRLRAEELAAELVATKAQRDRYVDRLLKGLRGL